jgi:FAD:protein FMN transferase
MKCPEPLANPHHFTHEAMHTTFSLRIRGLEDADARGMARECFDQIDILESRLSRFLEGSDISLINRMSPGETLFISESTHQCLLAGMDALARTGGLFDITLGKRIQHQKSGDDGPLPPVTGQITIHPDVAAVTCVEAGREIDLGGIGKGFALDHLKKLLIDWGAEDALLCAGASSLLALGPQSWPIDLAGSKGALRVLLQDQSISASGTGIQGAHIVHPAGADAMPAAPCARIWAQASTAVMAEVWSTALMLLDPAELPAILGEIDELSAVYAERDGVPSQLR